MKNPQLFVVVDNNNMDTDDWEAASNFDYAKTRAIERAENRNGRVLVYKMIPVFAAQLKVTTEVITENIGEESP